jgi:hypothetical protein
MWKRVTKYKTMPIRAPPTLTADKDGSRYFPPLVENVGKPQPRVPQGPRTKSARRIIAAIEQKRNESMSQQVKTNPLCYVSAVIERLPVVKPPLKTWEIDFAAVQARAWEEIEQALPPSIVKQNFIENPPWAVDAFKEIFEHRADSLLPLVSPPKVDDAKASTAANAAAQATTATEVGGKKGKQQKKKEAKDAGKTDSASKSSVGGDAATTAAAKGPTAPVSESAVWQKTMADLGIELAETAVDEDMENAMKLHVELKKKKDDEQADFVAAPRITEADKTNDTKSLERKLWHKLYLVVKRKGKWGFPRVVRTEKEGLLAAAHRAAFGIFPERRKIDLYFVSNCPIGYRPADTAKEFMLKVQLMHGGNLDRRLCAEPIEDFAWLTPTEIADLLVGKDGSEDEYTYLIRMFGDDWWEDPTDSTEMCPPEDDMTKKPLKQLKDGEIKRRVREQADQWEAMRNKASEAPQQ